MQILTKAGLGLAVFLAAAQVPAGEDAQHLSGFLTDYTGLKEVEGSEGALVNLYGADSPRAVLGQYDKVMLDPIEVVMHPDSEYAGIDPRGLVKITDYLHDAIVRALEPEYPVVSQAGAGVLRMRIALTGIKRKKPERSALGYVPIALVFSAAKGAVDAVGGKEKIVVETSIEAEGIDTATNLPVFGFVDRRLGQAKTVMEGEMTWDDGKAALDFWAEKFRRRMDEAHGKQGPATQDMFDSDW